MTSLLRQEGRRVVLVFTDGVDMPMNFSTHNVSLHDAMKRAQEEDVMVYAIGLEGHVPYGGRHAPMSGGRMGGFGGRRGGGGMVSQKPDEGLAKIAMETGGGYFELTNTGDLSSTFATVADELHRQYALGFTPEKLDGKSHKHASRTSRRSIGSRRHPEPGIHFDRV
jgi:VWFA-related protein